MVGNARTGLVGLAAFLLIVPIASGFGNHHSGKTSSPSVSYSVPYAYYYYPFYYEPTPYYYCPPTSPRIVPVPDARPTIASPVPALPSQTMEPPLNPQQPVKAAGALQSPIIITTKSVSAAIPGSPPIPKDRCRVGFWNLSGRDVTLTIDNRTMTLAKDRALTIDLDRQFAWQADQQPQHVERIPEGQSTHEIVVR